MATNADKQANLEQIARDNNLKIQVHAPRVTTDTARPAEQGHWYARDGTPMYTVVGANGLERDTNLRDARKLSLVPSVTGIIRMMDRPGLAHWQQEQLLMAALTLPRLPHEPEKSWITRVWQDSREQARKAAEFGTAVHAAVQGFFEGKTARHDFVPFIQCAVDELDEEFPDAKWDAEQPFADPKGYGGKIDLKTGHDGMGAVIDIKTKEFSLDDLPLKPYDENYMQLAAYARGIGLPNARCGNLFISVNNPGLASLVMHKPIDLIRGLIMFDSCLALWKAKNKYDPSFTREPA